MIPFSSGNRVVSYRATPPHILPGIATRRRRSRSAFLSVITTIGAEVIAWLGRHPLFLITLIGIVALLPTLLIGLSLQTHDGLTHARWHRAFLDQLSRGELYPRWLPELNGGLGSPAFYFYPPLPYYIASLFSFLAPIDWMGTHRLGLTAGMMMVGSGLAARLWLRNFCGEKQALIGSILYMILPFHLSIDLWVRGAFGQFCAYTWLPLILLAVHGIAKGNRLAPLGLTAAWAALILTHLPTMLIFAPIPLLYALAVGTEERRIRSAIIVVGAMVLGAGITGGYLGTSLTHQSYVNIGALTADSFYYRNNFVFAPEFILSMKYRNVVAWMILLFAGSSLFEWLASKGQKNTLPPEQIRAGNFWRVVTAGSFFMMTPLSIPIWEMIPPLQTIQFSQRFTVIFTLGLAAGLPLLLKRQQHRNQHTSRNQHKGRLVLAGAGLLSLIFSARTLLSYYGGEAAHQRSASTHKELLQAIDVPEYRTRWGKAIITGGTDTLLSLIERLGSKECEARIIEGNGRIISVEKETTNWVIRTCGSTETTLQLHSFYYPGWIAECDSAEATIHPSTDYGLILVTLPAGNRTVRVRMTRTPQEQLGYVVSEISFGLFGLLMIAVTLRRRRKRRQPIAP